MSDQSPTLLLVADTGAPAGIAEHLAASLPDALAAREPDTGWQVAVDTDGFAVDEDTPLDELIATVDPAARTADVVIYLTDSPRREGTTPVAAEISVPERFGVISVPGLGGVAVERRVRVLAQRMLAEVADLTGRDHAPSGRVTRTEDGDTVRYLTPSALSRLRLLSGMVYANRPWRVLTGMSKVLMAAFATGAVSLAYPTMWQLSTTMGPWRLTAATILASVAMIAWLIIEHGLWERPDSAGGRERAVLYNASTVITISIGVVVFHLGLFVLLLVTAWWTLPPDMVAENIGRPFKFSTLATMTWLVAAVATLGGALGSGMEDDDAVRAAAYGPRQRQRAEKNR